MRDALRERLLPAYVALLRRRLDPVYLPRHVAVVMDGNRRWARQQGLDNVSLGHEAGAEHLIPLLDWCAAVGIRHVTVFVASLDNIARRDPAEVAFLMHLAEDVIARHFTQGDARWRVRVAGRLDALPDSTAHALKDTVERTRERALDGELTVAIGYSGRAEIVDAVRGVLDDASAEGASLAEVAGLPAEQIAAELTQRLGGPDRPDPELVIRTSGEQRLSDFLLWQSTRSQLWFCDVYWPGFREVDLLRALRGYVRRRRAGAGG